MVPASVSSGVNRKRALAKAIAPCREPKGAVPGLRSVERAIRTPARRIFAIGGRASSFRKEDAPGISTATASCAKTQPF